MVKNRRSETAYTQSDSTGGRFLRGGFREGGENGQVSLSGGGGQMFGHGVTNTSRVQCDGKYSDKEVSVFARHSVQIVVHHS